MQRLNRNFRISKLIENESQGRQQPPRSKTNQGPRHGRRVYSLENYSQENEKPATTAKPHISIHEDQDRQHEELASANQRRKSRAEQRRRSTHSRSPGKSAGSSGGGPQHMLLVRRLLKTPATTRARPF